MPNLPLRLCLPLAAIAVAAGCATRASMDERYDQSLHRWLGASRADLVAHWGRPAAARGTDGLEYLTFIVNDDVVNQAPLPAYTVVASGAPVINQPTVAPTVPARCITRFELHGGVVAGWTFDGLSCGAPN